MSNSKTTKARQLGRSEDAAAHTPKLAAEIAEARPSKQAPSWRTVLAIHPAAEIDPLMSPEEQLALGEDIKKNKLKLPIVFYDDMLLDGRNRLDGLERAGVALVEWCEGCGEDGKGGWDFELSVEFQSAAELHFNEGEINPYDYVASANHHRRHLKPDERIKGETELRRRAIADQEKLKAIVDFLKLHPKWSDRRIARELKASPTTVGRVRRRLEDAGELSAVDTRVDERGANRKGRNKPNRKGRRKDTGEQPKPSTADTRTGEPADSGGDSQEPELSTVDTRTGAPADNGGDPTESADWLRRVHAAAAGAAAAGGATGGGEVPAVPEPAPESERLDPTSMPPGVMSVEELLQAWHRASEQERKVLENVVLDWFFRQATGVVVANQILNFGRENLAEEVLERLGGHACNNGRDELTRAFLDAAGAGHVWKSASPRFKTALRAILEPAEREAESVVTADKVEQRMAQAGGADDGASTGIPAFLRRLPPTPSRTPPGRPAR
jgi:hypothetical protein